MTQEYANLQSPASCQEKTHLLGEKEVRQRRKDRPYTGRDLGWVRVESGCKGTQENVLGRWEYSVPLRCCLYECVPLSAILAGHQEASF